MNETYPLMIVHTVKMEDNHKKEYLCSPVRALSQYPPGCAAGSVPARTEIGYAESKE